MFDVAKEITGQTLGRLIVLKRSGTAKGRAMWECLCDCGNKIVISGHGLRSGNAKSCGCWQRDWAKINCAKMHQLPHGSLKHGEAMVGKKTARWLMFQGAKSRARRDGVDFSISLNDIKIPTHCPVLGVSIERHVGGRGPARNSPTLDRISASDGYVKDNVRVVSHRANRLKADANSDELSAILRDLIMIEQEEVDHLCRS